MDFYSNHVPVKFWKRSDGDWPLVAERVTDRVTTGGWSPPTASRSGCTGGRESCLMRLSCAATTGSATYPSTWVAARPSTAQPA